MFKGLINIKVKQMIKLKFLYKSFMFLSVLFWVNKSYGQILRSPSIDQTKNSLLEDSIVRVYLMLFIFILIVVAIVQFVRYRKNQMHHQTMNKIIEKGVEMPDGYIQNYIKKHTRSDFRNGIIMIGLSIGLFLACSIISGSLAIGSVGLVPLFVGIAYIIIGAYDK